MEPPGGEADRPDGAGRWRGPAAVALTLAAVAPVLVIVATRTGRPYLPVQDLAFIDLRVRDVWSSDIPLVGAYSRGFSHPGPLQLWLLALPSGLFGSPAWATLVAGAVLQGVAIVAAARLAWRRGGLPIVLGVLGVLLLSYPGPWLFVHHWNPNIALPFFTVYLLLVWSVALGERRRLVWAVVVGTFLVQSHIGYTVLVLVPAAWAAVLVWRDAGGDAAELRRAWARPVLTGALVAAVLWAPAVIEQLTTPQGGNIRSIVGYFTRGREEVAGLRRAAGLFAAEFTAPPPWLGGDERFEPLSPEVVPSSLAWLLVPALLVGGACWALRRTPSRAARRLVGLTITTSITGVAAMAQLRGSLEPYLFLWRPVLATSLILSVLLLLASAVRLERRRPLWAAGGALLAVLVVLRAGTLAVDAARLDRNEVLPFEPVARTVLAELDERPLPSTPLLMRGIGVGGLLEGLIDELDRRGVDVRVDERFRYKWGQRRGATGEDVGAVWYVVQDGFLVSDLTRRPGATVLVRLQGLDDGREAELTELQRALTAELRRAGRSELVGFLDSPLIAFILDDVGGLDRESVDRVAELNAASEEAGPCRCAVIAFPASMADGLLEDVDLQPRVRVED